jgi:hypothetical protein
MQKVCKSPSWDATFGATVGGDNFDRAAFKRRMAQMETVIDTALSEQSKLF